MIQYLVDVRFVLSVDVELRFNHLIRTVSVSWGSQQADVKVAPGWRHTVLLVFDLFQNYYNINVPKYIVKIHINQIKLTTRLTL